MKVQDCSPIMQSRVVFSRSSIAFTPPIAGCYCFANIYDDVLYIGQTDCLQRRLGQHLDDSRMTSRTSLGLVSWFYYAEIPERELRITEQKLVGDYLLKEGELPPLNRIRP